MENLKNAKKIGKVTQVMGPVVDVTFDGDLPDVREYVYSSTRLLSFSTLANWLSTYVRGTVIVILESCGSGSSVYISDASLACLSSPSGVEGHSSTCQSLRSSIYAGIMSPEIRVFSVKCIGSPKCENLSSTSWSFSRPQYP